MAMGDPMNILFHNHDGRSSVFDRIPGKHSVLRDPASEVSFYGSQQWSPKPSSGRLICDMRRHHAYSRQMLPKGAIRKCVNCGGPEPGCDPFTGLVYRMPHKPYFADWMAN